MIGGVVFVGIDPGFDGAVSVVDQAGRFVGTYDTPTLVVKNGRGQKRVYQAREMVKILAEVAHLYVVARVGLEDVHAMPGQGVRSMFSLGHGVGLWEGLLAGMGFSYEKIPPQRWKKIMLDGMGKEKDAAVYKAQQVFPAAPLRLKKHHGRAEALLLAEYVRRILDVKAESAQHLLPPTGAGIAHERAAA